MKRKTMIGYTLAAALCAAPAMAGSPFFVTFFLLSVIWYISVARGLFQFGQTAQGGAE